MLVAAVGVVIMAAAAGETEVETKPGADKMEEEEEYASTDQATARAIIGSASMQCAPCKAGAKGCGCSARCTAKDPVSMIVIATVERIADSEGIFHFKI